MKAAPDAIRFDPDRGEHSGAYLPGAPVWEPFEGLDVLFPDVSVEVDPNDDEEGSAP